MKAWSFYRHMPVYLADGKRLGRTEEVGHGMEYLHIQQGHVLVYDWYVPMDAVESVTIDGVRLKVSLATMRANRWNIPPGAYLARQGATPGYEYTSPDDTPRVTQPVRNDSAEST